MLRITTHNDAETFTFQVEGRLIGEWAKELEQSWTRAAPVCGKRRRIVDLTGILFIDEEGQRVLKKLCREGARFQTSGPMTSSIVAEIIEKQRKHHHGALVGAALLLLVGVSAHAAQGASPAGPLHLSSHDVVEIALPQNPQVQIANLKLAVAQEELARAKDNQITALHRGNQARADLPQPPAE